MTETSQTMVETQQSRNRFILTDRIRQLAECAASRYQSRPPSLHEHNRTHAFFDLHADLPNAERHARALAFAMVHEPVHVFAEERIHGIFYDGWRNHTVPAESAWVDHSPQHIANRRSLHEIAGFDQITGRHLPADQRTLLVDTGAAPGHVAWNYAWMLEKGAERMLEEHRAALRAAGDAKAAEYCGGVIVMLEAMLEWNRRHVEALKAMLADAPSSGDRQRIEESIAVLEQVPARPARNFREAVQSFYFNWLCVIYENPYGGNSPGRLDYFLWPYLRSEWEAGTISRQEVSELIAELFIKIDERVHPHDGCVHTIVVGGMGPDRSDAVNPLSVIMLDVFEKLNITHPAVYTRISRVNPPAYVDRCVEYLLNGGNRAQVLNDDAILKAMTRGGRIPAADAALYMCGGCMELNPHGLNSDLLFAFIYNVPKTLELTITGGEDLLTGARRLDVPATLEDCDQFEDFYKAFLAQARRILLAKFQSLDIWSEEMARHRPAFLLSSMIADCFERKREQQDGGARYSDYGGTPLGIQNAADALTAIRLAVYEQRFCDRGELVRAMKANFRGFEPLRLRLRGLPKYGQGHAEADAMMNRLLGDICAIFDSYRNRHGRYIKPIIFTFTWAPMIGDTLGATADGQLARTPIAHGITPQAQGLASGLTTAMSSCVSLQQACVAGGASTMWDMDHAWINFDLMKSILRTFLAQGGQIFQGNTTDVEEMKRAVENPERYPHLLVRVGGYSARFTALPPSVQKEIIQRYRHGAPRGQERARQVVAAR